MPLFFILFVVIPVIEILLLIKVGQLIGGWYTVALVLTSAFIGVNMLRYQGVSTLAKAKERIDRGELPLGEMRDGIVIAVGGALLITPGFVTDFLGFCCLIPFTRQWFVSLFSAVLSKLNIQSQVHMDQQQNYQQSRPHQTRSGSQDSGDIIEGEYVDLDERRPEDSDDHRRLK